jgi:hypothetical protein
VLPGASTAAGPVPAVPSAARPRFWLSAVEASLLWLVLLGFWLFTGPRNDPKLIEQLEAAPNRPLSEWTDEELATDHAALDRQGWVSFWRR